jgi:hypothetical protein
LHTSIISLTPTTRQGKFRCRLLFPKFKGVERGGQQEAEHGNQIEHIGWALKAEIEAGSPNGGLFLDSLGAALASHLLVRHNSRSVRFRPVRGRMPGRHAGGGPHGARLTRLGIEPRTHEE